MDVPKWVTPQNLPPSDSSLAYISWENEGGACAPSSEPVPNHEHVDAEQPKSGKSAGSARRRRVSGPDGDEGVQRLQSDADPVYRWITIVLRCLELAAGIVK